MAYDPTSGSTVNPDVAAFLKQRGYGYGGFENKPKAPTVPTTGPAGQTVTGAPAITPPPQLPAAPTQNPYSTAPQPATPVPQPIAPMPTPAIVIGLG